LGTNFIEVSSDDYAALGRLDQGLETLEVVGTDDAASVRGLLSWNANRMSLAFNVESIEKGENLKILWSRPFSTASQFQKKMSKGLHYSFKHSTRPYKIFSVVTKLSCEIFHFFTIRHYKEGVKSDRLRENTYKYFA